MNQNGKVNIKTLTESLEATGLQLRGINGKTNTKFDGEGWSYRTYTRPLTIQAYPGMCESSSCGFHHKQICAREPMMISW